MPRSKLRSSMSIDEVQSIQAVREKVDIETVAMNGRLIKRPKFMRAQISPRFRAVGSIETDEIEYDNYVKWAITIASIIRVPPCVNPTHEPLQSSREEYYYIDSTPVGYLFANNFEEGILSHTYDDGQGNVTNVTYELEKADLYNWNRTDINTNVKVIAIAPGGYLKISSTPIRVIIDSVSLYAIGCPGDVVKLGVFAGSYYEITKSMTGDWVNTRGDFAFGVVAGDYIIVRAPDTNTYPVFVDVIRNTFMT